MSEEAVAQTIGPHRPLISREAQSEQRHLRLHSLLRLLGPGLITGAANDDPSAVGTYAKAGAAFGFSLLWVPPVIFPMMSAAVFLCSKLGAVTGLGIAGVLRRYYSRRLLYPVVIALMIANIVEAGADTLEGVIAEMLRARTSERLPQPSVCWSRFRPPSSF